MKDIGLLNPEVASDAVKLYNTLPDKSNTTLEEGIRTVEALETVRKHKELLDAVVKEERPW